MISNLDRLSIDYVIAPALSAIYFYGLKNREKRSVLRAQLLAISTNGEYIQDNINKELRPDIQLAFKEITAYLNSTDYKADFFLLGNMPPGRNEIQDYILNILHSIEYYLDDTDRVPTPSAHAEIDTAIKQILSLATISSNTKFKKTINLVHRICNESEEITLSSPIELPVKQLLEIKKKYENAANDAINLALQQRLFLLSCIRERPQQYVSTRPGTRIINHPIQQEHHEQVVMPRVAFTVFAIVILGAGVYLLPSLFNTYLPARTTRPLWPAGMTDLSNSTAQIDHLNANIKLDNFDHIEFPFRNYDNPASHLMSEASYAIISGRNFANHEDLSVGLEQTLQRTFSRVIHHNMKFMEIYTGIWAFLAEHGRNMTRQAAYGITLQLSPQQANYLRALEALRAGFEALLKEHYPHYASGLSCNHHQNPLEQIGSLNDLIKLEFESNHNLYYERNALFYDWLNLMQKFGINYPGLKLPNYVETEIEFIKLPQTVLTAMNQAMQDENCPWWHAPLRLVTSTVDELQNTLCHAWKNMRPVLQTTKNNPKSFQSTTFVPPASIRK